MPAIENLASNKTSLATAWLPAARLPTAMKLRHCAAAVVGAVALQWCSVSMAQAVPVPDPQEWTAMSPEQQSDRRVELRRQLKNASPEEREDFRKRMRESLQGMNPEDRKAMIAKAREGWNAMTPEQREKFKAERSEKLKAMPPEQRKELLQQRQAMLEKLSPDERAALREKLKTR